MDKFINTAKLRSLEKKVANDEISYSKMIEIINYEAQKFYNKNYILLPRNDNQTFLDKLTRLVTHLKQHISVYKEWKDEDIASTNSIAIFFNSRYNLNKFIEHEQNGLKIK